VVASQSYSVFYLTAEGKAEGFARRDDFLNYPGTTKPIDFQTGEICWTHELGGMGSGLLTTAGNLFFAGDASGHVLPIDSTTGKTLWHSTVAANQANGVITYEPNGKQCVVVGAGDSLFAFALGASH
jgi:alcohol dehydrogenase (cytochrome c)